MTDKGWRDYWGGPGPWGPMRPAPAPPDPPTCDPNALTGCCRWDHDHEEEAL